MTDERIREYAEALFELAAEKSAQREYYDALKLIDGVFTENPEYMELIYSPAIALSERQAAVEAAFAETVPEYVLSFTQLLIERGRIADFHTAALVFKELLNDSLKVSTAYVRSAVPLDDEQKERLKEKLEKMSGHSVKLKYSVDGSMLGGMTVELDGTVMDGSLKRRLHDIKEVMGK